MTLMAPNPVFKVKASLKWDISTTVRLSHKGQRSSCRGRGHIVAASRTACCFKQTKTCRWS